MINSDFSVEFYDPSGTKQIWQRLSNGDVLISTIKGAKMYLGMLPVGWSMKVHQSYHRSDTAGNKYQEDKMTFKKGLYAEQLLGALVLPQWY